MVIYELRTYNLQPTLVGDWLQLYKAHALDVQLEYLGKLVGFFTTEIGNLNQVVHLWAFESLDDRDDRRTRMAVDARWQEFGRRNKDLGAVTHLESRVLKPTDFSPIR